MKFNYDHLDLISSTYYSMLASPDALADISSIASLLFITPSANSSYKVNVFPYYHYDPSSINILSQCLGLKSLFPNAYTIGITFETYDTFEACLSRTLSLPSLLKLFMFYLSFNIPNSKLFISFSISSTLNVVKEFLYKSSDNLLNFST